MYVMICGNTTQPATSGSGSRARPLMFLLHFLWDLVPPLLQSGGIIMPMPLPQMVCGSVLAARRFVEFQVDILHIFFSSQLANLFI